jgi:hypothetical protein
MHNDQKLFKTELTKQLAYISSFIGIDVDVIKKSNVTNIAKLFRHLNFLSVPLPEKPITEFEFKGETYSINDILLKQEFQDFISIEIALSDKGGDVLNALPLLISIMCKRKGESLDDYDVEERAKIFLDLPVTITNGLSVFFLSNEKMSKVLSQLSSQQKSLIQMKAKSLLTILKPQVGRGLLIRLQIFLLRSWIKYTMLQPIKFSISMQLKFFIIKCKRICRKLKHKIYNII